MVTRTAGANNGLEATDGSADGVGLLASSVFGRVLSISFQERDGGYRLY